MQSHREEMGLDSWCEREARPGLSATEPVIWASRDSQAAVRGCKSCPEVKPFLSLLAMVTGVCVSSLCKVGSSSEGQCIFLIARKGDF